MHRILGPVFIGFALALPGHSIAEQTKPGQQWIEDSNRYTQMLVDIHVRHSPEDGSAQGLSQYDPQISVLTLADELAERAERDAVIEKVKAQLPRENDRNVAQDLQILVHAIDLEDRAQDFDTRRVVPFINASEIVFQGLRSLLDDQVSAERRPAAELRLKNMPGSRRDSGR